ncbi:hypothetical protein C0431_13065 [bacterium]|nr:hypothetical protein [bacterium]
MSSIDDILALEAKEILREENPSTLKSWVDDIDYALGELPSIKSRILEQLQAVNQKKDLERIVSSRGQIDSYKESSPIDEGALNPRGVITYIQEGTCMNEVKYFLSNEKNKEIVSLEKIKSVDSIDEIHRLQEALSQEWSSLTNKIGGYAKDKDTVEGFCRAVDDRREKLLGHDKEKARESIFLTVLELEQKILRSTDVELPTYMSTFEAINTLKEQYKPE